MLTEQECKRVLHDMVYERFTEAMKDFDHAKAKHEQVVGEGQRMRDMSDDPLCNLSLALGFEHEQAAKERQLQENMEQCGHEVKVMSEVFKFLRDNILGYEINWKMNPVPMKRRMHLGE